MKLFFESVLFRIVRITLRPDNFFRGSFGKLKLVIAVEAFAVAEVVGATVRAVGPVAKVVTVAEGAHDRHGARVIAAFATTLLTVPGTAKVSRNVPVRAWPSGCFTVHTKYEKRLCHDGRKDCGHQNTSLPHHRPQDLNSNCFLGFVLFF